jgi:phospholipid-binding lipoprotein MlaA
MRVCNLPRVRIVVLSLPLLLAVALPGLAEEALGSVTSPAPSSPVGIDEEVDDLLEIHLFEEEATPLSDPIEPWNRGVLWFNRGLDKVLFTPITKAYGFVMPDPGKRAVRRFFKNLATPPILVNDMLQGEGKRALVTGTRFVVNTTVGIVGLFDPAASIGLERHVSDFGQTLFLYGVGSGPYVMLPIFGPSTGRDSVGFAVDLALRPDLWLLGGTPIVMLGVGDGVSTRELHQQDLDELERASIDYYSALRSVYWMDRRHFLEESQLARELRRREAAEAKAKELAKAADEEEADREIEVVPPEAGSEPPDVAAP